MSESTDTRDWIAGKLADAQAEMKFASRIRWLIALIHIGVLAIVVAISIGFSTFLIYINNSGVIHISELVRGAAVVDVSIIPVAVAFVCTPTICDNVYYRLNHRRLMRARRTP